MPYRLIARAPAERKRAAVLSCPQRQRGPPAHARETKAMSVQEASLVQVTRHRFTVADYERMCQVGIFSEDERLELVCGEFIQMSPIGERHAACVAILTQLITLRLQRSALVWVQNPPRLDEYSEPQADLAVLKSRDAHYRTSN